MPIHYSIDRGRRIVFTTWSDRLTYEELRAHLDELRDDPNFDPSFDQLLNLSDVSAISLTFNTLNSIKDHDPFSLESRRAVVAPTDVAYGTSRMYETIRGGGLTVFRNIELARTWLGLESLQGAKGPRKGC